MRPKSCCEIHFCHESHFFKPDKHSKKGNGVVELEPEEAEALRLKNVKELDQSEAALEMNISQSTFQRILSSAYKKVSQALTYGKAIKIKKRDD